MKIGDKTDDWERRQDAARIGAGAVSAVLAPETADRAPPTVDEIDEIEAMLWSVLLRCKKIAGTENVIMQEDVQRYRFLRVNIGLPGA